MLIGQPLTICNNERCENRDDNGKSQQNRRFHSFHLARRHVHVDHKNHIRHGHRLIVANVSSRTTVILLRKFNATVPIRHMRVTLPTLRGKEMVRG